MLCHGRPLSCAKKSKAAVPLAEGNDSEGEDMYGFLPKKLTVTPACIRRENVYEAAPRKAAAKSKVVTFLNEPPKVRLIQRRHSCAENYRSYAPGTYDGRPSALRSADSQPEHPEPQRLHQRPPSHPQQHLQQPQQPAWHQWQFPHRWSSGCAGNSVCGHYWRRMSPPSPSAMPRASSSSRPPPPGYHVAVRRAASFSASRGVNSNRLGLARSLRAGPLTSASVAAPSYPPLLGQQPHALRVDESVKFDVVVGGGGGGPSSNLNRAVSSSTSDLYVDPFALKRAQSRDLISVASSTSSMSEATVYRKIGPCDYVSVGDNPCHKSFRSKESSLDVQNNLINRCASVYSSLTVRSYFLPPFQWRTQKFALKRLWEGDEPRIYHRRMKIPRRGKYFLFGLFSIYYNTSTSRYITHQCV